MSHSALLMTAAEGLESSVAELRSRLGLEVEIASSRRAALQALGQREFSALILDQALAEADPEGADLLWRQAGLAVPVQVNLALSSPARVIREVRAALVRREQEMALSMRAAAAAVDSEIKNAVTGLLLQSQLAREAADLPPEAQARLEIVIELARELRRKLEVAQA
jgi:signal transduction histidine kinase